MSGSILYTEKDISSPSVQLVKIHPLVMFYMVDAYERAFYTLSSRHSGASQAGWESVQEKKDSKRASRDDNQVCHAVGILYGQYSGPNVSVLDCVACLPHLETRIDKKFMESAHARHMQMYPKEELVGFWSFSDDLVSWPRELFENRCCLYVWMRPSAPTKVNVFYMESGGKELVPLPVEYRIEASSEEQMGLAGLAGEHSSGRHVGEQGNVETGSLQAAGRELVSLLDKFSKVCKDKGEVLAKNKILGRRIFVAVKQAKLEESANGVLGGSQEAIDTFLRTLGKSDEAVAASENLMSLELH